MKKKILLIGCGCALLAIALVVCLVLVVGNGTEDETTLSSNGTTVTGPDGTQKPTDGTAPSGNTDPTDSSATTGSTAPDATTTPTVPDATTEPTVPSSPVVTEPTEPDVGPTDPSTGEEIIPTNPGTEPPNPDLSGEYDFGNITPGNITIDDWNAWDTRKRQAFVDWTDNVWDTLTAQERHNSMVVIWYGGYNCHTENHACKDEVSHNSLLVEMERGCPYCGKNDCPSFFALDENLFTKIDFTKCPEYGVEKDPTLYCQSCGNKFLSKCEAGEVGCTSVVSQDAPCYNCGEMRHVGECHNCVKKEK